jgi:AICAR transformylase/IMP cyclohydrolase PurH
MTAAYDRAISTTLAGISAAGTHRRRGRCRHAHPGARKSVLRYGEIHQQAALRRGELGVASAKQLRQASYNNLVDRRRLGLIGSSLIRRGAYQNTQPLRLR